MLHSMTSTSQLPSYVIGWLTTTRHLPYASRASQLELVESELERIRQSEQKMVLLMQKYDKEIDSTNVDIKETKRQMQLVNNTM